MKTKKFKQLVYKKPETCHAGNRGKEKEIIIPCWLCGKKLTFRNASVDHVFPKSLGGKNSPENYRIACVKCNQKKGARILSRKTKPRRNWNASQRGY